MGLQKELLDYCNRVIAGSRKAGKYEILAYKRFINDTKRDDIYFDEDYAEQCINLWEGVCHFPKGGLAGKPIRLTLFQKFVCLNILCWRKNNGMRKYKAGYIQLARKSTKTFCMALIAMAHLFLDAFPSPYIPVGANDEKQAKICVDMVGKIIERSPQLYAMVNKRGEVSKPITLYKYKDQYTQIIYKEDGKEGTIEAISSGAKTKDGSEPTCGIIDEYWAAENDNIREAIKTGMMMIEEKLLITITTAGFNKEGPCYSSLRETGVKVLQGIIEDDENFILICEMDEGDDWKDEENWSKSNPMRDEVPAIAENLRIDFKDALEKGGSTEVHFKTKNLNMWTNAESVWISDELWMECKREYSLDEFEDGIWFDGLDLAKSKDLNAHLMLTSRMEQCHYCKGTGITLNEEKEEVSCTPCTEDGQITPSGLLRHYYIFPFFWIPQEKSENHKDGIDYIKYAQQGLIKLTPGNVVDHRYITKYIIESSSKRNLKALGYDMALAYHGCVQELLEVNIPVQEVPQRADKRNPVIKFLEHLIEDRRMHHDGNEIMRWMLSNIVLFENVEGSYKFDKGKSKGKIDGWDALVNALHESMKPEAWEDVMDIRRLIG